MAHFAELDENNIVKQVIVVANPELLEDGIESEAKGIAFCQTLLGEDKKWIQTSWSGSFRYNFAGIGYTYDPIDDAFIAPQPYPSWILNSIKKWESPIPAPTDGKLYLWNEDSQSWDEMA